jgi:TolB-like protein/DNA-binding SARP family transcriptional activator/tetratricopeptide (TPR) repeat protein
VPLDLPASRKARALVAYLSLAVRAVSRRQLCELLWDVPNDPRGELRWCLCKVRSIVDEPGRRRVDTSGDSIRLDLADCFVDAIKIARASEAGLETLPPERLRSLSTLFSGEFLDGLELDRNPGFNAWLTAQRRRFRGCHAVLLERLAATATGDEVFEYLEKWLELAPFDLRVHEVLLHAFARRGQIREGEEHLAATGRLFEGEGLDCTPIRDRWRAVRACAVAAVPSPSDAPDRGGAAAAASTRPSIAILPFANLSGDPAQDYLSDGITEDIITDLSRWRMLAVLSRSASFRYRGIGADVGRIARELQVRYIVEGSVRRHGERIRITAQLIDTETGSHVWADRFDRERADVFQVQDEAVQTIVGTLVGRVQAADAQRARRKPPASLAAYECVLQGNALPWDDATAAAEATRLFETAIGIDPGYGFAHALLAVMRYREWCNDLAGSDDAALDESYRLAKRAVEIADNESTCFSILAQVCILRRSFDLGLQHMQRAIEINATNQWNTADMGNVLCHVGRAEEAVAWFKRARQIDPYFDPAWYRHGLGRAHLMLHRYDEAVAEFERASARPPQVSAYLAGCHARLGRSGRARAFAADCLEKRPDFTIGRLMAKVPFKDPADAAHLVECLRVARLPE